MVSESTKEYTLDEISKHNTNDSCWLIIGNLNNGGPKVYDVTKYLDDHPGGAEVLLDVAGQDADEFFEDIGHSNDAREELSKYLIGNFKMDAETLAKMKADAERAALAKENGGSSMQMLLLVILVAIAFGYYKTQMS
mmetsp:Transcript_29990/g.49519  ORF Transcript_29990/g.49519 Transcript_29990/m.49519 type:complete len:137 (-) Transcript_29990:203-613(-)|eukprot:CAMPEP_0119013592 /NCGR_PEP_ID=MMETSP1176-20130426/8540_1 /TAXON_ID=265551 /ORGANISM="Synedropsis recta cf, Strain CCMP1620" /LENGTH=136 /DNA_ID=CAMNT_0006966695 /DNA_START=70 /DNA_END=480 /DNA_ORIENTATION=+